jgi:4-aminobutyrate aminotransferase/(S)-3-amino-2-methylpropionate transaminase
MMRNEELLDQLKVVECPDATYPARDPSLVMHRAKGSLVYDVEGREYIDLCAGFGALALGHNPEAHRLVLMERLHASPGTGAPLITHGMGDVYSSAAKVELLSYLPTLMPSTLKVTALALTGSQAVELAIKSAMLATGRSRFIVFGGSYHGLDIGILPLTERADFRAPFRGFLREDRVISLPFRCSAQELDEVLAAGDFAAVLVEPVQGRTGCREAGVEWLGMLRRQCDKYGTLLVYDEVFTGLGRTGQYTFADYVPCDLLCLGKAFGGGFPISACVGTDSVMKAWPSSSGEAIHTGTFFGHPLSCDISLATLRELHDGQWVQKAAELGGEALVWLRTEFKDHSLVREIRGIGLMLVIELVEPGFGAKLMDMLRAKGIIALASGPRGESLSITPALNIPRALLKQALATIKVGLQELKGP